MNKFELGLTLRDKVSGFAGVAHSRVEFMTGNVQYGLQPAAKDGTLPDVITFDAHQLEQAPGTIVPYVPAPKDTGIVLGEKVKDIVSKFEGIAIRRTTFLNGCVYYAVLNEEKGKENPQEMFLEWKRLERTGAGVVAKLAKKESPLGQKARPPGGPNNRVAQRG